MTKAIIFDWGRTLYDPERSRLFPETKSVLANLSKKYKLAIVSLVSEGTVTDRSKLLKAQGVDRYLSSVMFSPLQKNTSYVGTLRKLKVRPREVAIVDDRVVRGIRWGNRYGCITVWLRRGKFKDELPTNDVDSPMFTIMNLNELLAILANSH